ncbi:anaphase-promoting complex component Cut20/Apc4 [Trichophyton rubrum]|uniref:Anaphase-promoting complex subunit 4 n=2 Tax=Trichophyton rubrum TaxID=5551 RepID=A0A178F8J3_TRIRU|nr:anaphase-promoting complex component Cut20/Apc4 [Trichophyton rubrum]
MASPASPSAIAAEEKEPATLNSVAEKDLAARCKPRTIAYCPNMDLVAVVTEDEQVNVYRLNGQRVFGGAYGLGEEDGEEGVVRAVGLRWKENGRVLAVACSDNRIRLLSSYSGKMVHSLTAEPAQVPFSSPQRPSGSISCIGWGVSFAETESLLKNLKDPEGKLSLDDLLMSDTKLSAHLGFLKEDLPRELALLDIEGSLPKLSTLPSTGDDDDVFSSRVSLDSIFHSPVKNPGDSVDVLLAGLDDGSIHMRIFESFEIGSIDVSSSLDGPDGDTDTSKRGYKTLLHASHPMSTTHALLFQSEAGMKVLNLDLRFITKAGRYLPLLASKVTQLQNLLRYIKQVQAQMHLEWKNARELPIRYLRNINEELKEQCHCDFVTATYHLIVTGDCYAPLKEFLATTISDRGQKRWEKTVAGGYEALRRLTYECLMPALERCGVLLSRLIGLSKYHRISPILGLETTYLKACVATLDCLTLLGHKVVLHSSIELKEFHAFSHWMQHEIKLQSTDPTSSTMDELVEAADEIDYGTTLGYVKGALTNSALQGFLQVPQPPPGAPGADPEDRKRWDVDIQDDGTFYEEYKKLVSQHESQRSVEGLSIPMLGDLTARLSAQCDRVFKQIAETQRRGTLFRSALKLNEDCDAAVLDMAMNFEVSTRLAFRAKLADGISQEYEGESLPSIYAAFRSRTTAHKFYIYRHILSVVNGVSSTKASLQATVELGSGSIQDLNIPYLPSKHDKVEIDFTAAEPAGSLHLALDRLVCHSFAPSSSGDREPVHLEVNGRRGRRVVCVLYADGRRYSVLDLDSALD